MALREKPADTRTVCKGHASQPAAGGGSSSMGAARSGRGTSSKIYAQWK
jgi:hypothetical protein